MNDQLPVTSIQFVSRGGLKMQAALDQFEFNPTGFICLDVGSSTGGFVDCLLQSGASRVYALDTCYGELAWKLRKDERVVVMERTNILHVQELPEPVDLVTIDAGWTRLELILPIVQKFLKPEGSIIALIKPHYQADKKLLVKGVLSPEDANDAKDLVLENIDKQLFKINQVIDSPILGGGGNREYLVYLTTSNL